MARPWKNKNKDIEYNNAQGYTTSRKGMDSAGRTITHHTWFNPATNRRISYDTYETVLGEEYIEGSGHEVDQKSGKVVARW